MVQPSRSGLGGMGRRRYQLMINDAPRSSKVWLNNIIDILVYICFLYVWMCKTWFRPFKFLIIQKKKAKSLATGIQKEMLEKKWQSIVPNRSDFKTYNLLNCYPHIKIYIGR